MGDISYAIQSHVEAAGFSIVRALVGHGIGRQMHEEPQVPNYGQAGRGPRLMAGQVLAIEPMVNAGSAEVMTRDDRWTVATRDGSLSAHFEHTVAVGNDGPDILWIRELESGWPKKKGSRSKGRSRAAAERDVPRRAQRS